MFKRLKYCPPKIKCLFLLLSTQMFSFQIFNRINYLCIGKGNCIVYVMLQDKFIFKLDLPFFDNKHIKQLKTINTT